MGPTVRPAAEAVAAGTALPLVPLPSQVSAVGGAGYALTPRTEVHAEGGPAATAVAEDLVELMRPSTGLSLPVDADGESGDGIEVRLDPGAGTGAEGYRLDAGPNGVVITAVSGAGLYHGVQTLRQLAPVQGPGTVPAVRITDQPRYGYRSGGLDVARHFFPVPEVEQYIDLLAQYKMNHLHLHLTDDEGWRIAIPGLPRLTGIGATSQSGGGPGGSYSTSDYKHLVAYAAARFITVVPEVDLPGHTNAAVAAYPDLACAGAPAPAPYTGTWFHYSQICTTEESTYTFVDHVVGALAAMTPGPYLGIGGDEVQGLSAAAQAAFTARVSGIVRTHGKTPMAWDDAATADKAGPALLGVWHPLTTGHEALRKQLVAAAKSGAKLLMEPADHAYLDQKYDASTKLGLNWAGYLTVQKAYSWDPNTYLTGLPAGAVIGVEAPIWSTSLRNVDDLDTMLLPRLPALAEVGWTPQAARVWAGFRLRLAAQAPRWDADRLAWTRAAGVSWP